MFKWGQELRKLREDLRLTLEELSEKTGIPRQTINSWELGGKETPDLIDIERLSRGLNKPIQELSLLFRGIANNVSNVDVNQSVTVKYVPLLGSVPAGTPWMPEEISPKEYIPIRYTELRGVNLKGVYSLIVKGDSLIGDRIEDKDYVLIEPYFEFSNGKIYLVEFGGQVVLRHVYKDDVQLRLKSSNGAFDDILVTEAEIKGRVVLSGKIPIPH